MTQCFHSLALYIYAVCKVLCFIVSDDDFEIKTKICSFNCLFCFYSYLELQDDFIFRNLFLFILIALSLIFSMLVY